VYAGPIIASNESMVYGEPFPTPTVADYIGFVNGDTPASLTTRGTQTTTADACPVGSYPIHESGAFDSNYTITNVDGAFTITQDSTITLQGHSSPVSFGQPVLFVAVCAASHSRP